MKCPHGAQAFVSSPESVACYCNGRKNEWRVDTREEREAVARANAQSRSNAEEWRSK